MSKSATPAPDTIKAAPSAQTQVPSVQASLETTTDSAATAGARGVGMAGGGSPQVPPSRFGSLLGQMQGTPQGQRGMVRGLQRSYGNQYVGQVIQAKLTVGQPGDVYEQEADRVADAVMRMPEPGLAVGGGVTNRIQPMRIQRMCAACEHGEEEEERIHRKEAGGDAPAVTPSMESRLDAARGGGQPLPESVRSFMEPRLGADFRGVRVHSGGEANALNRELRAQAFTRQRDVYFGAGRYRPETQEGQRLLAHELTHVVQQTGTPGLSAQSFTGGETERISRQEASASETDRETSRVLTAEETARAMHTAFFPETGDLEAILQIAGSISLSWLTSGVSTLLVREETLWASPQIDLALQILQQAPTTDRQSVYQIYQESYNHTFLEDFLNLGSESSFREAVVSVSPYLTLRERIELYLIRESVPPILDLDVLVGGQPGSRVFDDAIVVESLGLATAEQLSELRGVYSFTQLLRNNLEPQPLYEARKLLDPTNIYDAARERLESALGIFSDEETVVYDILLDLIPSDRRRLYSEFQSHFLRIDAASRPPRDPYDRHGVEPEQFESAYMRTLRRIVFGSEAEGLVARLSVASSGEDVSAVINRIEARRREFSSLESFLEQPGYRNIDRWVNAQVRLEELGNLQEELQQGLTTSSIFQTLYRQFESNPSGGRSQARRLGLSIEYARYEIIQREGTLIAFVDAISSLPIGEQQEVLVSDDISTALGRLDSGEQRAIRNLAQIEPSPEDVGIPSFPEDSAQGRVLLSLAEGEDILQVIEYIWGLGQTERIALSRPNGYIRSRLDAIFGRDRLHFLLLRVLNSDEQGGHAIEVDELSSILRASFGSPASTNPNWSLLEFTLSRLSARAQRILQRGYLLTRNPEASVASESIFGESNGDAVQLYRSVEQAAQVEGLGVDDLQRLLDLSLGVPDLEQLETEADRREVAAFLLARVRDRRSQETDEVGEYFTSTDESLWIAATQFEQAYTQYLTAHEGEDSATLTQDELAALAHLEQAVASRTSEYTQALETVGQIAATVAGIGVGILIGFLTGGVGFLAFGAGALGGGLTRLIAQEIIQGEHFEAMGAEGGREFTTGAFEGALGVLSNGLARTAIAGLTGEAVSSQLAGAAVRSCESALSRAGRRVALGALEGAIDGAISGFVGGAVYTVMDENFWRRSIWQQVQALGQAAIREGVIGAATGGVLGGGFTALAEGRALTRRILAPSRSHYSADGLSLLSSTAARRGLSPDEAFNELSMGLEAAQRSGQRLDELEELLLPNSHRWRRDPRTRQWCRFSGNGDCYDSFGDPRELDFSGRTTYGRLAEARDWLDSEQDLRPEVFSEVPTQPASERGRSLTTTRNTTGRSGTPTQAQLLENLDDVARLNFHGVMNMAGEGESVRLLQGLYDTNVTWNDILDLPANSGAEDLLRTGLQERGISVDDIESAITSLRSREGSIHVVVGTTPLREAIDYRTVAGAVPGSGSNVHHVDPLYLGGSHQEEALLELANPPHDFIHDWMNGLFMPTSAGLGGNVTLQPNSLQRAAQSQTRPGAAIIDVDPISPLFGSIRYFPL